MGSIGPYEENTEQWSSYTERFECFVIANKIEDDTQVPTFLAVMGPKTYNLLRCLVQPNKPISKSYDDIVAILAAHFSPKPLVIAERFRFHKRNQEEGESVAVFVAALRRLAEHCEFGAALNDTIRDRLVCGMRSEAAQKRLLTESALTLDKAMEISVSMELAARDAHQLSTSGKLHQVATEDKGAQNKCYRCGRTGHVADGCWSKDVECRKCGKRGHIERACKGKADKQTKQGFKKKQSVHSLQPSHATEDDNRSSDEEAVYVLSVKGGPDGYWLTPLLEGRPVRMEVDTGAAVSLVSYAVYKEKLQHLPLQKTSLTLKTYTGESVATKGVVHVTVKVKNQTAKLPLYVVTGNFPSLLGRSWLGVLTLDWPAIRQVCKGDSHLTTVLNKHAEVFKDGLGTMRDITVNLNLKPESRPRFFKARTVPYAIRPKVEAELEALIKSGVLEPVSRSDWGTPIVPVPKKDGSVRICGDFKVTVNPVLAAEQYPLPLINDLFAGLAGGEKFSKIDLNQAYLQMQVDEQSRDMLTVVTHKGLFRYCRLPFGITSAPALFQRAMDQILSGLNGVQCYLDDILVTGKNEEEHLENLDATLQRLEEYGLRVRRSKCDFFQNSVEYLGHVIDSEGLHKAPSKTKALTDAPPPENVSQLRSFLGLLNYYGKFIENLSTLLQPLHELLCQGKAWKWTERRQAAFEQTKTALLDSDALTHFDPTLPLQLACDASPYGVGAVISHIMPTGEERPIAFASRTLNQAERNYAQIEREALGIVFGVRKFHQYLYGRKFTLLTDHRPLTTIFGSHTGIPSLAASRMQRWALLLSAHDYDIKYRKAELHANADGLSRLPLPDAHSEPPRSSLPPQAGIFYFRQVEEAPITYAQVKRHTRNDPVLSKVLDIVLHGGRGDLPELKPYLTRRNELSVQAGCLLWGRRVIVPPELRKKLLQQLHAGHSGMVRMKELARSYFWWPGLDGQIEETARTCPSCQQVRSMPQAAPLHPWEWPEEPWQRVHVDFAGPFEDRMFLVAVDAHSKWPEVSIMRSTTAEKTIEKLGEIFSRFGFPEQLVSDNGPQFVSQEFERFLEANGVQHIRSAPYHPSTNGLAERFVQSMKHGLKASQGQGSLHQRLNGFLLAYRNVPHATTKVAPAGLLLRRQLRTNFDLLKPPKTKETVRRNQQAQVERREQRAKERVFHPGDYVLARNYGNGPKWIPATVLAQTGPVSYTVRTTDDIVWRRHTDQLLAGSSAALPVPPALPAESGERDRPEQPTVTQEVPRAVEPVSPGPASPAELPPELSPVSNLPSTPATAGVELPGGGGNRRYPERERCSPKRLDL